MSALGQKQTFAPQKVMPALPPKADIRRRKTNVHFGPKADTGQVIYCSDWLTFSIPAFTHSSSTPGDPERPTPAITSLPILIGTPPLIAITFGSVVCSRRTGRVFISCRKASVVILKVMAE